MMGHWADWDADKRKMLGRLPKWKMELKVDGTRWDAGLELAAWNHFPPQKLITIWGLLRVWLMGGKHNCLSQDALELPLMKESSLTEVCLKNKYNFMLHSSVNTASPVWQNNVWCEKVRAEVVYYCSFPRRFSRIFTKEWRMSIRRTQLLLWSYQVI